MGSPDPDIRPPLPDDLSADTVAALCDVLRDLADAVATPTGSSPAAANANATPTPNGGSAKTA